MITRRIPLDDLINREAKRLALEAFMSSNNITPDKPLPPDTEIQVEALLSGTNLYHDLAKEIILAQKSAHEEALKAIGLGTEPLELDL